MSRRQYSDGDPGPSQPNRLRPSNTDPASGRFPSTDHHGPPTAQLSHDDYTIAWICALPLEFEASRAMFDELHPLLAAQPRDNNTYVLGRVQQRNVVMCCLPSGQIGMNNAAIVATDLHRSFRNIRATLLVGIGGGAPSKDNDIRLGDIVVGMRVMQYDMGKNIGDGKFQMTGTPVIPARLLGSAVSTFRSAHTQDASSARVEAVLQARLPYHVRPSQPDQLFQASYEHTPNMLTCSYCDRSKLTQRCARETHGPKIHYGGIATANTVMKNARARDELARELSVLCFEMEAGGIMDNQCMPIRGICDYSDSHKNKAWQDYAAAVAAAYARELLEALPPVFSEPARVQTRRNMASEDLTDEDREKIKNRRAQLLKSLDFPQRNARASNIQRAHAKTCQWFLGHPQYKDWLDPTKQQQTHGFLWIVGKAGAGKSTIMKFAYLETKESFKATEKTISKAPEKTIASFFFNARGVSLERSIAGMYRTLLVQLLRAYPDLQAVLDDPDIIPSNQTDCPSLNILKELFRSAVLLLKKGSFTCFVDALDECDEQEVQDMVEFFRELAEETTAAAIHFRICFSSRPYPYIYTGTEVLLVLENEAGHTDDLSQYVTNRLRINNPSLFSELKAQILEKASGVFMWVVLVVDILNRESNNGSLALLQKLATIPARLSDLFKSILNRDKHDADRLLHSVFWVLCANRPLSPLEFRHAIWVAELGQGEVDAVLKDNSHGTAKNLVTSSSKGLAEITRSSDPTVQFIHESVRDFLVKDNGLREMWPDLGIEWEACAHEKLKNCCDTYLSLEGVQTILQRYKKGGQKDIMIAWNETYPFLEYACQNVLHHANAAALAHPQNDFIDRFFTPTNVLALNYVKNTPKLYSLDVPTLYVLAEQGCEALVQLQVKKTPATYTSEYYNHPLIAALECANYGSAVAILDLPSHMYEGIDITDGYEGLPREVPGGKAQYLSLTVLTWAAHAGRLNLIKALILGGADVNGQDKNQSTALLWASCRRYEQVVRLLLRNGADIEAQDEPGTTALMWAAKSRNYHSMTRLLIEKGANVEARDKSGLTALMQASAAGNLTAVEMLLDEGRADVNAQDDRGCTALMLAAYAGHADVVAHLLRNNAERRIQNGTGWTALSFAMNREHLAVLRLLRP